MRNIDLSLLTDEELQEIAARKRRIARAEQAEQLVAYCASDELFGQEKPAEHHALLCDFLQQVERGEIERLMSSCRRVRQRVRIRACASRAGI